MVSLLPALEAAGGAAHAADLEAGEAEGGGVRGVPWPGRQCDDSGDAVARRTARVLHPLAAHQVQGRAPGRFRRSHPSPRRLSDTDMADLAAYYQAQPALRRPAATDSTKVAEGRRLADLYHCTSCHKPDLIGQEQGGAPGRPGLRLPPPPPPGLQGQDRLRPRRHHDHRHTTSQRRRDRQPGPRHPHARSRPVTAPLPRKAAQRRRSPRIRVHPPRAEPCLGLYMRAVLPRFPSPADAWHEPARRGQRRIWIANTAAGSGMSRGGRRHNALFSVVLHSSPTGAGG